MGAAFKLTDAIDDNIVKKLKIIGEQSESTATSYAKLVEQMTQIQRFNPKGLEELQQKAAKYGETARQLRETQEKLNALQKSHQELLAKVATDMQNAARAANEQAKANNANAEATSKSAKSLHESATALDKIRNIRTNYSDQIQQISQYMIELDRLVRNEKTLATQLKNGLITREQYNARLAEGKIAQKEFKDAISSTTKEISNSRKEETQLEGSLVSLRAQLSNLTKEYDNLSRADRTGARGKELQESIKGIQTELKEAENATGRFQREVGSYEKAIESAMSRNLPFIGQIKSMVEGAGGLAGALKAAGVAAMNFGKQMLVLLANPVVATVAALVAAFVALKSAMGAVVDTARSNEEQSARLNAAMSPLTVIGDRITRSMEGLADVYIKVSGAVLQAVASFTDWLGVTKGLSEESKKYAKYEENLLQLAIDRRTNNEENALSEAKVSELRSKSYERDVYTSKERLNFIREAQKEEEKVYQRNLVIAQRELALLEELGERTKNDAALNDKISQARINLTNVTTRYNNSLRFLNRQEQSILRENEKSIESTKAKIDVEEELERTRLILIKDNREREIAEIRRSTNEKLILIKGNSEAEIELRKNLMEILRQKEAEINKKYDEESAKQSREAARKRMDEQARIYADASTFYTLALQEELDIAAELYRKGEISKEEYEKKKLKLTQDYSLEQARMALEMLESQLEVEGLSEEELLKLKERITAAKISLAEKEREAVVKAADEETKKQEEAKKKREEELQFMKDTLDELESEADSMVPGLGKVFDGLNDLFEKLADKQKLTAEDILKSVASIAQGVSEIVGGIYDAQIEDLERQEEANEETKEKELAKIEELAEKGAISEEEAEARKRAAEDKTAKKNEEIARKKAALQTRQAKLEKAANIISTIMNTAVAVMKAWSQGGIFAAPMAAMIAAMGAIQLATIVAQPIPKYAKGTKGHKGGLAWVGDGGVSETIITNKGAFLTPDTPTLVDLPKGAKVIPYAIDMEYLKTRANDLDGLMAYRKENELPPITIENDYSGLERRIEKLEASQRKEIRELMKVIKSRDYKRFGDSI